jgi:transposase, IS30 family
MSHKPLTQGERYQIQAYVQANISPTQIAVLMKRHRTTIQRELKRGVVDPHQSYEAALAQQQFGQRARASRNARRISEQDWSLINSYLRLWLSPEQVTCRLRAETGSSACTESIYQHIYRDKAAAGDLISYLRCQKVRRKRYGSGQERRGVLRNRIGIEQRPALVEQRQRLGDWEGDTVIGHGHRGVLVTLVERMSRYTLMCSLPNREAEPVSAAIIDMLRLHKQQCHTLTFDNGKEFADHQFFGSYLQADVYFAHPYHSWERGTNENTNGLIRQYFPKWMSLLEVSQQDVDDVMHRLNHRPRKCLGWRTPHEVFHDLPMRALN